MNRESRKRSFWFVFVTASVAVVSATLSGTLATRAFQGIPRERALEELAFYPSGDWLEPMSLGEGMLLADLTWLRAVQYYGEQRLTDSRFRLLYHAFDVVTDFDPEHRNAFVFGGTSLAQEGRQFDRGVALLKKGRAANPELWVYPFELGFIHFVERRDYFHASLWFREAMRKPGCPSYVERFAAFSTERAGHRETALELWQRVAEAAKNPVLREKAIAEALELARDTPEEGAVREWARGVLARAPGGEDS